MYHVLLPIDADEARVRSQIDAIRDLPNASEDVRVDALYVYEEIDAPADEAGSTYIEQVNRNLEDLQGVPETADLVVESLADAGIETAVHDVTGDPPTAIVEVADELDVDAIVLGARKRSPVGKVLFGSVTQAVIIATDRPVLVTTA